MTRIHVVIPTHTTRHLAATLGALAASENPPTSVVVSVDGDAGDFVDLVARIALSPETTTAVVTRAHQGEPRLNQVRNNALRALRQLNWAEPDDMVLVIDGDMAIGPRSLGAHLDAANSGADVVLASRVNLTEPETETLSKLLVSGDFSQAQALMQGFWKNDHPSLSARQHRLERQARLKSVPLLGRVLVKGHKPKILGGHHALRCSLFEKINGYDERFVGYGYDDDDLARRVHAVGARTAVCIDTIPAFHLWHPTRAPTRPPDAPGYTTFTKSWTPRAESGIDDGAEQPEPEINIVCGAKPGG